MSSKKNMTYLIGTFEKMTTPEPLVKEGKKPVMRSLVTITTEDGQKGFFDIRENIIKDISSLNIKQGTKVEIGFVLMGSEKEGRTYNNLFINYISHAR